jgi:endo-1,4-beta-D-glucanase Y
MWKQTFVSGGKVIRPENGNDTVSEGIAYGMMIAASMKDKELFDQLYSYWKGHDAGGGLMTWCIPAGSGSCSASGGSATDADEDAAYALLQADKVFGGGSYKSDAMALIGQVWAKDIDKASKLPTGGSNYADTSSKVTNPSYFAPSHYAAFKKAGDSNDWDGVIAAVYKAINTSLAGTNANGLYAAWCSNNCSAIGSNGDNNDKFYQYDSHRIPMRIGMDYCFNSRADAKTYVAKTTKFFATNANAGLNGVGRIFDMYDPASSNAAAAQPTPQNNSASIIGTAAVGAMADGSQQAFTNDAYQFVFDLITRTTLSTDTKDTSKKTPYSYYNGTVGMLTALIMTGAFVQP